MWTSHNKIKGLLCAEKNDLLNTFNAIVNNVSGSKLLSDIIAFLDDDNMYMKNVSDKNKISLVSLMKQYYIACGDLFIVDSKLDKLVAVAKQEIYSIEATSGVRIATKSEVENGATGLVVTEKCLLTLEKYKLLNLLMWTITGRLSYFRQAGFEYKYDKETGLTDTIYDLIVRSGADIKNMINWVEKKREFDSDIHSLKQALKSGKYKYPDYAADEVKVDITIKQLLFYLSNNLPRKSTNQRYRDALYLVIKEQENKYFKLTPGNISFMRGVYSELSSGAGKADSTDDETNSALRDECENLLKGKSAGLIKGDHFAFTIISTLQRYNYSKCTKKQYDIIREATLKISDKGAEDKETKEAFEASQVIFDIDAEIAGVSLVDISNALGSGKFTFDK